MYRLKDMNVILPKLYLTTINRGTPTCIKDVFWAKVNYIAMPTKLCTSFTFTLLTVKPKVYLQYFAILQRTEQNNCRVPKKRGT
jgi:hypothetical protein